MYRRLELSDETMSGSGGGSSALARGCGTDEGDVDELAAVSSARGTATSESATTCGWIDT